MLRAVMRMRRERKRRAMIGARRFDRRIWVAPARELDA